MNGSKNSLEDRIVEQITIHDVIGEYKLAEMVIGRENMTELPEFNTAFYNLYKKKIINIAQKSNINFISFTKVLH